MGFSDFFINNKGKNERLNDTKHGVRKDQVAKKYQPLFDMYDKNGDGTLEDSELEGLFSDLSDFAGGDKVLDSNENKMVASLFTIKEPTENVNGVGQNFVQRQATVDDIDFMGFVKSVSDAGKDIKSTTTTKGEDGGDIIETEYSDGTIETIYYYPDGEFKMKKLRQDAVNTEVSYSIGQSYDQRYTQEEIEKIIKEEHSQAVNTYNAEKARATVENGIIAAQPQSLKAYTQFFMDNNVTSHTNTTEIHRREEKYSPRYIVETLGIDISTDEGKKIIERLNQLPEEAMNEILDGKEIKELLADNDLTPTFDNISNVLEIIYGVTLRDEEELKASEPQHNKLITQIKAVNMMSDLYEMIAEWNDQYTDGLGLFGMGSEGIGYIINKLGIDGENHYQFADSCREWAKRASELKPLNPEKFNEGFKNIYGKDAKKWGIDFDEKAFNKLFSIVEANKATNEKGELTQEYKDAILKACNIVADNPNESTYNQVMNGLGEALLMIMSLGFASEAEGGQVLARTAMSTFGKLGTQIASKQAGNKLLQGALRYSGKAVSLLGPAITEGTKMATYTAITGTAANITNRVVKSDSEENSLEKFVQTEGQVLDATMSSFGFGAFAGIFGATVTQKVVNAVSKTSSKVTKSLSENFAKGSVDATEVYAKVLEKSIPTKLGEVAAFATDVVGFTGFETVLTLVNNMDGFPDKVSVDDITNLIKEEFKEQGYSLGQMKLISHLIMWMSGSRSARMNSANYLKENLPQLKGVKVEETNDKYNIKLADGRTIECKNATEMISSLHLMVRGETAFSSKFDEKAEISDTKTDGGKEKVKTCRAATEKELNQIKEKIQSSNFISYISDNDIKELMNLATQDVELANSCADFMLKRTYLNFEAIKKSCEINRELTLELLTKQYTPDLKSRIKSSYSIKDKIKALVPSNEKTELFSSCEDILDVVKAAQKAPALTTELLNMATRSNAGEVSGYVEICKVDKELGLKLFKEKRFNSAEAKYFAKALKTNRELALECLDNYINGMNINNIVYATKKCPEVMNKAKKLILKGQNSYCEYLQLNKVADYINGFGEYTNKSIEELTYAQKCKLLAKLSSVIGLHDYSDVPKEIKEMFPSATLDVNSPKYMSIIKQLQNETIPENIEPMFDGVKAEYSSDVKTLTQNPSESTLNNLVEKYSIQLTSENKDLALKTINQIVKNPEFEKLSDTDKETLVFASIMSAKISEECPESDVALEAYGKATELGFSKLDTEKAYAIVKNANLIQKFMDTNKDMIDHNFANQVDINNRTNVFDQLAFNLKDGNTFELAKMLYTTRDVDGLSRYLNKALEQRIFEMKSDDIILPQVSENTYREKAQTQEVRRGDKVYTVPVVYSSDIDNFYAHVHSIQGVSGIGKGANKDEVAKLASIESNNTIASDRVFCATYVSDGHYCAIGDGLILEVPTGKQYLGVGHDIGSRAKNVESLVTDYYRENGAKSITQNYSSTKETTYQERQMISKNIKEIMGIDDAEYVKRIEKLKSQLQGESMTMEALETLDPEMADAYKVFLSRTNVNQEHGMEALMQPSNEKSSNNWNETLVGQFKVVGLATRSLDEISETFLKKAQEEGIPIVVLQDKPNDTKARYQNAAISNTTKVNTNEPLTLSQRIENANSREETEIIIEIDDQGRQVTTTKDSFGKAIKKSTLIDDDLEFVTEYSYDNQGRKIREVSNINGNPYSSCEYLYDNQGNLVNETYTASNGQKSKVNYSYDKNNRLIKEVITDYDGEPIINEYSYDNQGNLVKEVSKLDKNVTTTEYVYTSDGTKEIRTDFNENGKPSSSSEKITTSDGTKEIRTYFDENGKQSGSMEIITTSDGTKEITTYFDENGKQSSSSEEITTSDGTKEITTYFDEKTGVLRKQRTTETTTDTLGHTVQKIVTESDGRVTKYNYEYPTDGGIITKKTIVTYFNGRQVEYHYDGSDTIINEIEINPGNKKVFVQNVDRLSDYYPTPDASTITFTPRNWFGIKKSVQCQVSTVSDVKSYLKSFRKSVSNAQIKKLVKLFKTHPERFNRIANSGFFDLVDYGYIDNNKLKSLFGGAGINEHTTFSNRTLSEIRRVKEQLAAGITPTLVKEMPANADETWVYQNVKLGEVYQQNGRLFVREDAHTFTELKLSKEKFDELFPPLSSAFAQGNLGDCWLVSSLENLMDYPQGRASIFKMFTQQGDDIFIQFETGSQPIPFENGKVLNNQGKQINGATGIQMLEQAYAYHRNHCLDVTTLSPAQVSDLTNPENLMFRLESGLERDAFENIVGNNANTVDDANEARTIIENSANSIDNIIAISFVEPESHTDPNYHLYGHHAYALKAFDPNTQMCYLTNPWNTSTLIEVPYEVVIENLSSLVIMNFK